MLERIVEGRTDLVFDNWRNASAGFKNQRWRVIDAMVPYYGDVSALRFLLSKGEALQSFGEDMGLNAAAFHGHWRCSIPGGERGKRELP